MTNAPESRKTHITRIFGTNKQGERLDDLWIDVERMDIVKSAMQVPPNMQWQGMQRKFRWCDDPTSDDYDPNGTPARNIDILKVCDPEGNLEDPDEWVPLKVIRGIRQRVETGTEDNGGGAMDRFLKSVGSDELEMERVVEVRKIIHYDTNVDDLVQSAADADAGLKEYVIAAEDYAKIPGSDDKAQYVEHEIITYLKHKGNAGDFSDIGRQTKLLNDYLIDESEPPEGKFVGLNGFNPPYRLDPYQNIINVNLSSRQAVVLGLSAVGGGSFESLVSEDGIAWANDLGAATNAASGFGKTVVSTGTELIAFGRPGKGDKCFIRVNESGEIRRGVLDNAGDLAWTRVATIPIDEGGAIYSCVQAGDAFFISYIVGDPDNADTFDEPLLAVSFDGKHFTMGIKPFPGILDAAQDAIEAGGGASPHPNGVAGCVAYDPKSKTYVITGTFLRSYWGTFIIADEERMFNTVDNCFMSAKSKTGLTWAAQFDTRTAGGLEGIAGGGTGPAQSVPSSVAFGNGLFVACNGLKVPTESGDLVIARWGAGVSVSSDGSTWESSQLPGQTINLNNCSVGSAVKFVKHKNGTFAGFFVMASSRQLEGVANTNDLFMSFDGRNWTKVMSTELYGWVMSIINKNKGEVVSI